MKSVTRIVVLLALCAIVAPAFAGGGEWTNKLRFGVSYFAPTSDGTGMYSFLDTFEADPFAVNAKAKSGFGVQIGYEHKLTPLMGLEGYVGYYKPKFELRDPEFNNEALFNSNKPSASVIPVGVALNFHVVQSEKVDVYVGPTVAYMFYGKPKFNYDETVFEDGFTYGTLNFKLKNELAFGAVAGADVQFSGWDLVVRLQYLRAKAEVDEIRDDWNDVEFEDSGTAMEALSEGFKPNPLILTVGAGFRF